MNTLKTIYDKIGKTELAKHEIELGLIDDLKKNNTLALKEYAVYETNRKKAILAIQDCKSYLRQYAIILTKNIALIDDSKAKAKELGLDLPADVLKIAKDSNAGTTAFKTMQADLIQAEKLI